MKIIKINVFNSRFIGIKKFEKTAIIDKTNAPKIIDTYICSIPLFLLEKKKIPALKRQNVPINENKKI